MRYGALVAAFLTLAHFPLLAHAAEPMDTLAALSPAADWLAAHQLADGGWSFDHRRAPGCDGKCDRHGDMVDARNAATSLSILALLATGQGEKDSKHEIKLKAGLKFLIGELREKGGGERLTAEEGGGSMYSHGLATLALCEAYQVTGDMALREPALKALRHILFAQDPVGGGWRYAPKQAGDTSVSGWQIAALTSGHRAMLEVPQEAFDKSSGFLDKMQAEEGARYGYTGPGAGQATTAIGLVCRRRLGWKSDHPSFVNGSKYVATAGPSKTNLYFDFYATQAMRLADRDSWTDWHDKMSLILLGTQATQGHAAGSWQLDGDHGATHGGRLYCTTLAALILGVEHGKLPAFRNR